MAKIQEEALLSFNNMKRFSMGLFPELEFYRFNIVRDPRAPVKDGHNASVQEMQKKAKLLAVDYAKFMDLVAQAREIQEQMLIGAMEKKGCDINQENFDAAVMDLTAEISESMEWNIKLPFDCIYMSFYNKTPYIDELRKQLRQDNLGEYEFCDGFLLSQTAVFECNMTFQGTAFHYGIRPIIDQGVVTLNDRDAITLGELNVLLAIYSIFAEIEKAGLTTVSKSSAEYHVKMPRFRRRLSYIPPDYHLVEIRESLYRSVETESDGVGGLSYQSDVRAHTATWILRGPLPMSAKTERWLRKDGRRKVIQSESDIDPEVREIFRKRNITLRENEWISVLVVPVKAHTRGKGRYVPSIYVADRVFGGIYCKNDLGFSSRPQRSHMFRFTKCF